MKRNVRDTSLLAYQEIKYALGEMEQTVLVAFNAYPDSTDGEIAVKLGYGANRNRVSPRRNRLVELGYLTESGKRRCQASGKVCYTWHIKPKSENEE
jgi:helix-turn-helix protein